MKFAVPPTPSSVIMSRTQYQIYHNGSYDPPKKEYNLHYGDVRGDVLSRPHDINISCSVVK